jgi:hypothetical protein
MRLLMATMMVLTVWAASVQQEATEMTGAWELVTEEAAFSPRDTAEDCVFDGKMWLSNGYFHGNILHRDMYWSTDGKTWTRIEGETAYDGYAEMTVYDGKMWAIKQSVWNSEDGINWTQVLDKTPFGVRGYGELVVHNDAMFQLGSGRDVYRSTDGVEWDCVLAETPYGNRSGAAVATYAGKLWVMGGGSPGANDPVEKGYETITTHNDVWSSADGVTWERVTEHAPWAARKWFIAWEYAGKLWIIGGYDNVNSDNFADIWYTEDGVEWTRFESEPMWSSRHEPTVYVYDGSLWVVAGNHWPVQNDVWRLTLEEE